VGFQNKKHLLRYLYITINCKEIMNTDKLVKAIQILVQEEVKTVLPKLVKEAVKLETAKLLKENQQLKKVLVKTKSEPTFMDMDLNENNNIK
jgi:hypothetical protein